MVMNIFTPQRPFAFLVVLVTSLLSSCAYLQPRQSEEAPAVAPSAQLPDGSIRVDTEDPQIARLWSAAEEARLQGNDAAALEHLYEALEVNPQNSLLWSRAAEVQLDNLEAAQAENFAIKSNTFAGDNTALLYRNWLIIEHARDLRGDLLGVRSAHKKVQQYQYQ